MTNFEKIKQMTKEEFSYFLYEHIDCDACVVDCCCGSYKDCYKNFIKWLDEQTKEIDRLKAEKKQLQEQLNSANAGNVNCSGCELVEINAVKEFARKVKECSCCDNFFKDGKWHRYVFVDDIDELLKKYER